MQEGHDATGVENMKKVKDRILSIKFNADKSSSMTWNFKPQQHEIKVIHFFLNITYFQLFLLCS